MSVTITEPFLQVYAAVVVVTIFLCLQVAVKPYATLEMNALETSALSTLWLTLMCAVFYWRLEDVTTSHSADPVTTVVLGANFVMLVAFVAAVVRIWRIRVVMGVLFCVWDGGKLRAWSDAVHVLLLVFRVDVWQLSSLSPAVSVALQRVRDTPLSSLVVGRLVPARVVQKRQRRSGLGPDSTVASSPSALENSDSDDDDVTTEDQTALTVNPMSQSSSAASAAGSTQTLPGGVGFSLQGNDSDDDDNDDGQQSRGVDSAPLRQPLHRHGARGGQRRTELELVPTLAHHRVSFPATGANSTATGPTSTSALAVALPLRRDMLSPHVTAAIAGAQAGVIKTPRRVSRVERMARGEAADSHAASTVGSADGSHEQPVSPLQRPASPSSTAAARKRAALSRNSSIGSSPSPSPRRSPESAAGIVMPELSLGASSRAAVPHTPTAGASSGQSRTSSGEQVTVNPPSFGTDGRTISY